MSVWRIFSHWQETENRLPATTVMQKISTGSTFIVGEDEEGEVACCLPCHEESRHEQSDGQSQCAWYVREKPDYLPYVERLNYHNVRRPKKIARHPSCVISLSTI